MRGALAGLMAGGLVGALWGATNNFGLWNSAVAAGLMGALVGLCVRHWKEAVRGALAGLVTGACLGTLIGGYTFFGPLWGAEPAYEVTDSAIGTGLMGALAGTWIGLIAAAPHSTRKTQHTRPRNPT
ncbi:hypothetical protein, partial [Actinomadura sp. KC345]|uniref:hypothetical protein n=1 Tax=Actinomadura sp. KC345 TaxID=2530371 RepID=UPI001A9D90E7